MDKFKYLINKDIYKYITQYIFIGSLCDFQKNKYLLNLWFIFLY